LISVPASLEKTGLNPGESIIIEMDTATVTDTRGNSPSASWTVTTICSDLIDDAGHVLAPQNLAYRVKDLTITGGLLITAQSLSSMRTVGIILTATSGQGTNSATWIPVLTVSVPLEQVEGTYKGSITHSVF
jgi:hypothetical protein